MRRNVLKIILLLVLPYLTAAAQSDVNMKFGKPTKEEMQMTVYEAEPEADAVVLCRLTDVEYTVQTSGFLVDYREKFRIKVLKPNGARFAKVVIPYQVSMSVGNNVGGLKISALALPFAAGGSSNTYFEGETGSMTEEVFGTDADESVEDIKAAAFNQEGSKVVKTTLKKTDIVKTKIDEHNYQMEFTVPNVKEGTVIEYEYTVHSQLFWELHDWYAQGEIPVVFAKLDMNIPNYLIFNIEDHGIQRLTYTCTVGTLNYKVESDPLAKPVWVNTNHYVYIGRNLMGMPKDDYVWNAQDYWAGITAELKQYRLQGMKQMDYAKTWDQIDEMVLTSDDLGMHLNDHSPLSDELKTAKVEEIADMRERVAAVYKLVMGKVKWNGKYALSPAPTLETLKKGEGSNADINLLLIQSLHDAGLNASPVMLRTRDLGMLPYNFPSVRKLSTFIVGVVMPSGKNIYLDASNKNGWLNMLPEVMLVERARLVQKGKSQWANLQQESKAERSTVIDAKLSADGTLTGKQVNRNEGGETNETTFTKKGQVADGQISICPFPDKMITNPFTAEKRKMPVEFPSVNSDRIVINITLPEGYEMDGERRNTTITTPDKGIEGRIITTTTEGRVQMSCQVSINKIAHPENSYADLRQIFDMLSKYTSEELTFKKK
ncbi:MAG: hypothetical protein IKI26_11415 [Prevotella sp.]|nr:hypothetical protein [Prevotella sp.]